MPKDIEELISEAKGLLEHVTANLIETCQALGMAQREVQRATLGHPDRRLLLRIILDLEMRTPEPNLIIVDDGSACFQKLQEALSRAEPKAVKLADLCRDMLPGPIPDIKLPPRQTWKRKRKRYFNEKG